MDRPPAEAGWMAGWLDGWMGLPEGEDFDTAALVFALDVLPPATFDIEPTRWVPTLSFTAYVRALPVPGPVQLHYNVGLVCDERVDQACTVWDTAGNLVAQSVQLASVRLTPEAGTT